MDLCYQPGTEVPGGGGNGYQISDHRFTSSFSNIVSIPGIDYLSLDPAEPLPSKMGKTLRNISEAMRVFVLLFNARTENEGIHTISVTNPEDGMSHNVVLMFESEDDATRFGIMLEAQDFPSPTVEAFDEEEITEFCESANYDCKLIPEGTLTIPPEANVEETDWQAVEKQRRSSSPEFDLDQMRRRLEGLL
ncbi:MAG: DUF3110 domain-containing protein [Leptolyngbyaceae bacterium]|nr:DUF3110 domain-containing protein [Leptolyngbyaceae bacterium]